MVFVQPAQLGILIEIANQFCLCLVITIGQDPAHMRIKKAAQRGGMQILVHIRMAMMMAVIGGPPKHNLLRGHGRYKRHYELERAAGRERTKREIAVIPRRHRKHQDVIQGETNNQIRPVEFEKECRETSEMNEEERRRTDKRD